MLKRSSIAMMLIACLALAACGGDTPAGSSSQAARKEQDPADRFKVAATKAQGWETLRFSMSMNSASLGVISGEGEQDMARQKLRMTMTMPAPGTPTGTMTMEQIMAGTNMYMKSPVFGELLEGGKSWVKFDLAQMGDAMGIDIAALLDQTQIDPQGPVSFLGGAQGEIEELGTELVRNTPTTHYRFTVDLAASAAALPPDLAEAIKPMFEEMPATFPAEAWMDEDNMVRRIRYSMALPGVEGQPAEEIETQMEFFDFGAAFEIVEPGPSEFVDLGQMLQEAP
jgi:hypothetical protein